MSNAGVVTSRIVKRRKAFGLLAPVQLALAAGAGAWQARCERRALMEMPDYLLKDIGLERDSDGTVRRGRL